MGPPVYHELYEVNGAVSIGVIKSEDVVHHLFCISAWESLHLKC